MAIESSMSQMNNILTFPHFMDIMIDYHKSYLNKEFIKYWISLNESSSIILYYKNESNNMYVIPNILPKGVYIDDINNYYGYDDMVILDVWQFKIILLSNGFQAYFKFIEDCICSYGNYLSDFGNYDTEEYRRHVYDIM